MSGGGTNTVQTTVPDWLQPYMTGALRTASGLTPGMGIPDTTYTMQDGTVVTMPGTPAPDPKSLVAGMTPEQQAGIDQIKNTAMGPNPSANAAAANMFETSGALLDPNSNPYLQNTFNLAANQVQNRLASEFAGNGSNVTNSLPVQADQMNDLATQLYGGAYQQGLNTMTQATMMAPNIQQGTYLPGQQLYQAGSQIQQQNQNQINAPYNALSWYSGLLGMNGSPFMGQQSNIGTNSTMQDAGLGLASAGTLAELWMMY